MQIIFSFLKRLSYQMCEQAGQLLDVQRRLAQSIAECQGINPESLVPKEVLHIRITTSLLWTISNSGPRQSALDLCPPLNGLVPDHVHRMVSGLRHTLQHHT